jgi:REP element-mobilizing transposase RayT
MRNRRRWRWPDGYYHVFNRGARRLLIFANDADRADFVRLLGMCTQKWNVEVVAWTLMTNHYHLCLKGTGEAIGKVIRDLEKTYARRFNGRTGFEGALFQGRFGSVWLPDLRAVAYVTRYIHLNCRDLGIRPDTYRWSSIGAYLGRRWAPRWLNPRAVLDFVGGTSAYATYLAQAPERRKRTERLDEVQEVFIGHLQERVAEVLKGKEGIRGRASIPVLAAWVAHKAFGARPRVIARALGFSSGHCASSLIHRMNQLLETHRDLRATVEQVLIK